MIRFINFEKYSVDFLNERVNGGQFFRTDVRSQGADLVKGDSQHRAVSFRLRAVFSKCERVRGEFDALGLENLFFELHRRAERCFFIAWQNHVRIVEMLQIRLGMRCLYSFGGYNHVLGGENINGVGINIEEFFAEFCHFGSGLIWILTRENSVDFKGTNTTHHHIILNHITSREFM